MTPRAATTDPVEAGRPARRVVAAVFATIASLAIGNVPAIAGLVTGYFETTAADSKTEIEADGETASVSESNSLIMTTNLEWFARPSSAISFRVGGFFQYTEGTFESPLSRTNSETLRSRPYFGLDLRAETITAGTNYQHDRLEVGDATLVFDSFGAFINWTPERLPSIRVGYLDNTSRDENRQTIDRSERSFRLRSQYDVTDVVRLDYAGSVFESDNKIDQTISRTTTHLLKGAYSDRMWNNRITIAADGTAGWRDVDTRSQGSGDVTIPRFPARGLFLLTDTPEFDALGPSPGLIDGNRLTPAGPDLGLVPPGEDERLRNMGFEFLDPTTSDVARIWIDREIPLAIARTFSWAVYVSEDNDLWALHSTVGVASFGPFENRFEFEFPEVTARFLKVVVAPLDSSVPQAGDWPDILVTETELFLRRPVGDVETVSSADEQSATATARVLLNRPYDAYYDTNYFIRTGSRRATEWVLTNALSFRRPIGRVYAVGGRVERNDVQNDDRVDAFHRYSLRFSANPLPSLRHAILFSGANGSVDGLSSNDAAVSLTSWARLYEGVEASLSLAKSYVDRSGGDQIEVDRLNASALITPHRSLHIRLAASTRSSETRSPAADGTFVQFQDFQVVSVTYSPVPAVYVFGSYQRQDRDDVDPQDVRRFQASFSPFPRGNLRLSIDFYDEYRPDSGATIRRVTPTLRWSIRPGWLFEASYTRATEDVMVLTEKRDTIFARLQVFF